MSERAMRSIRDREERLHSIEKESYRFMKDEGNKLFRLKPELKKEYEKIQKEILDIEDDTRNYRYFLNIRGLVLYILGELRFEAQEIEDGEKGEIRKKRTNKNISSLLENLSLNYCDEFSFLLYYVDFKNEYQRIEKSGVKKGYFMIWLLKQICQELKFQVDTADIRFIRYWITRRFSGGISLYFASVPRFEFNYVSEDYYHLTHDKIKDFLVKNLWAMKEYLDDEIRDIDDKLYDIDSADILPHYV